MCKTNILVDSDGTAQIAGLGNASILPHSILAGTVESNARSDRLSRAHAPELICPRALPNLTEPTRPTKASDMYAFGVMAWEVRVDSFVRCRSVSSLETGSHGETAFL